MKVQRIQLNEAGVEDNLSFIDFIKKHQNIVKAWVKVGLPTTDPEGYYNKLKDIARNLSKSEDDLVWKDLLDYAKQSSNSNNGSNQPGSLRDKVRGLLININKVSRDEIINIIKQAAASTRVSGLPASIGNNLEHTSTNTLKSFVIAMDEELLNKDSRIWPAFANKKVKDILSVDTTFSMFYNILIDRHLKFTKEYLDDENSILYNDNLYYKVKNNEDRESLLELDIDKKVDNGKLNKSINNGSYREYISDVSTSDNGLSPKIRQLTDDVKNALKGMNRNDVIDFISNMFGISKDKAKDIFDKIK